MKEIINTVMASLLSIMLGLTGTVVFVEPMCRHAATSFRLVPFPSPYTLMYLKNGIIPYGRQKRRGLTGESGYRWKGKKMPQSR